MFCNVIKSYFVPSLLLAAVGSVNGNSEVKESHSSYPCCEAPTIELTKHGETTWSTKNKPFAISNGTGTSTRCIPPCMTIEDGRMTVDECVNITATVVSSDEKNVAAEERIYYFVQPCSDSPSSLGSRATGSAGLLLLGLVIAGLNVK